MSHEESINDIARNISYEKLITLDENKYEKIFRFNQGIQRLKSKRIKNFY